MKDEFSLLLIPLIALAVVGIVTRSFAMGISWSWGFIVQCTAILVCGVLGFLVGPSWLFCIFGYLLFFLTWIWPHQLVSAFQTYLGLLNTEKAEQTALKLKYFYWGRAGEVWMDWVRVLSFYIKGNGQAADEILSKWQTNTPASIADQALRYRVFGRIVLCDWQSIVSDYEENKLPDTSSNTLIYVCRAYAELGRIDKATQCLEKAKLLESRSGAGSLALTLLPYFSLSGAISYLERIMQLLLDAKMAPPEYARKYWLGRCFAVSGDRDAASASLTQSLNLAKADVTVTGAWIRRIEYQLEQLSNSQVTQCGSDWSTLSQRIWRTFQKGIFVQSIVSPSKRSPIVGILCVLIALTFLISSVYSYIPGEEAESLSNMIFSYGWLDPHRVLAGEYWRLFTHLFLHKDLVHLMVNLIGLYWFGRIAINIFGPARFLFIYFLSGMLSGIAQTLLASDTIAVGASGAVMGVLGAVAAGILRLKSHLPESVRKTELYWLAGLALFSVISDKFVPRVAGYAHLGGMMAGLAFGLIVRLPRPSYDQLDVQPTTDLAANPSP